jgi:hypothetical protein
MDWTAALDAAAKAKEMVLANQQVSFYETWLTFPRDRWHIHHQQKYDCGHHYSQSRTPQQPMCSVGTQLLWSFYEGLELSLSNAFI